MKKKKVVAILFLVLALALVGILGYYWVDKKQDELMAGICELEDKSRISEMSGDLLVLSEPFVLSELKQTINLPRPPIIGHGNHYLCFESAENFKSIRSNRPELSIKVSARTRQGQAVVFKSEGWSEKILDSNSGSAAETLECLRIDPDRVLTVGQEIREFEMNSSARFSAAKMIWYSEGYYHAYCG